MIPTCILCDKFDRTCIYEKPTRTPLTRRYLSEVEDELARTKTLLQQFMPDTAHTHQVNFAEQVGDPGINPPSGLFSSDPQLPENNVDSHHHGPTGPMGPTASPGLRPHHYNPSRVIDGGILPHLPMPQSSARQGQQQQSPARSDRRSLGPSGLSLETPPSSNSFEWDERTGKASGDRFVDGMASLTSDANEGGYLGMSRQFLLHATLTCKQGSHPAQPCYASPTLSPLKQTILAPIRPREWPPPIRLRASPSH